MTETQAWVAVTLIVAVLVGAVWLFSVDRMTQTNVEKERTKQAYFEAIDRQPQDELGALMCNAEINVETQR